VCGRDCKKDTVEEKIQFIYIVPFADDPEQATGGKVLRESYTI